MTVIEANIQTVDDIERIVREAVAAKRPVQAMYQGKRRRLCPYALGRSEQGELRVLCWQYGVEGSADNWRCLTVEKLSRVERIDERWRSAPLDLRHQSCLATVELATDGHR